MENKKEFTLRRFSIEFREGYSFREDPAEQVDRYEGSVTFSNKECDVFTMKVYPELSFKILELINQKLAENTEILVNNIKAAIKNENDKI